MSSDEVRISSSLYATVSPDRTHNNTNHNNLSTNNTNNNMSTTHSMNTTRSTSTGRSSRSASATISSTQVQVPIRGVGVGVGVEAKVSSDDNHDNDNSNSNYDNSSYNNNDNNNDRDNYISNNNSIEMTTPAYLRNGNFHPHQPPVQPPQPVQPSPVQPSPVQQQPQPTISLTELKYGISSFHVIITPVTLTMILSALAVTYIQTPEIDTSSSLNDIYNVFDVSDEYSVSRNIGLSLINAFIIVCAVAAATFVLVFFYKYRCMRCLSGYMILSSALLLGLLGSLISMVAIQKYKITIDSITFYILLFNFAIVGTMSIFYCRGIPPYITQSYLVITSVILAWQLSQFNNWTAWCLLVLLALYDLCAVLTPCGPLKALIGLMSKDGAPALPGLLYEAQLPNGVERPSNSNGSGSGGNGSGDNNGNNGSSENGTRHSNRNSNDNSNGNGTASENERQNKRKKNRGNGDINGVENRNNSHSHSHSHDDNQQMTVENNNYSNSGSGSGSNMNAEMEDEEYMSAMGTGTHIRIGAGTGNGSSSSSSNDNTNQIAENQIQHQNRHGRNRNNGNSNDNTHTNTNTHTRVGKIPLAIAIIYKLPISSPLEFATQNVTNLPPPSDRRSQYTPKQLRTRVVVHFPRNGGHITNDDDDDDDDNGMEEDNSEVEPSSTTTSRIRSMFQKKKKSSSSTSSKYIVYDRHENVKRVLVVNEEGRVFEEVEGDDNDNDNALSNNSIKLGLGDFIFYSVLVSKAAQYSFTTFATCVLVILAGLGSTLVLLSVYHMALPALPISIFLGVTFYFLTRILMEPFLIQAIFELSVYV